MTTFDEAYVAAVTWLDERGLLLNSQLLQLAAGDEALRNEVRESLLSDGVAIDRYGVGLLRGESPITRPAPRSAHDDEESSDITFAEAVTFGEVPDSARDEHFPASGPNSEKPVEADWWLMAGGATRGPFTFAALRRMRQRGEVADTHLVRQGERGQWRGPRDVAGLAEVSNVMPAERSFAPTAQRTGTEEPLARNDRVRLGSPSPSVSPTQRAGVESRLTDAELQRGSNAGTAQRRAASQVAESSPSEVPEDLNGPVGAKGPGGASDDEGEFYLWEGGRPVGPVSRASLHERLANGLLLTDEFVQVGVDGEWQPVSKAMHMRRPPLKIPDRTRDLTDHETNVASRSGTGSNSTTTTNNKGFGSSAHSGTQPRSDASISTTGSTRAASRKPPGSTDNTPLLLDAQTNAGRAWQHTAVFVGGELRLRGIIAALVALIVLVVWLRQPPAASTIYREFTQYHAKLSELRTKRTGPTDWKQVTMRDQQRAQTLLDGLKARASAARPVEQQLLWAGRYGLVELFKKPADPAEFERLFTTHMSEAKRLLEGGKAESSPSTMKAASQPLSLPDTVGSSTEVGRPQGDSQK